MIEGKIKLLYELKHLPSIEFYKYLSYIFRNVVTNYIKQRITFTIDSFDIEFNVF